MDPAEGGETAKCVCFNENPNKTRTGGFTVKSGCQ